MTDKTGIPAISKRSGVPQYICEKVMEAFIAEARECILNNEKVVLQNLCSMEPYRMKDRKYINVITRKQEMLTDRKSVRFRLSVNLKKELNKNEY